MVASLAGPRTRRVCSGIGRPLQMYCSECHVPKGESGGRKTLAGPKLDRAPTREILIKLNTNGMPGTEMPGWELEPNDARVIVACVCMLGHRPFERLPGNVQRGGQVYVDAVCVRRRFIKGQGCDLGPELTGSGSTRSASYVGRAIKYPEVDAPQYFRQVRLFTKDRRRIEALVLTKTLSQSCS